MHIKFAPHFLIERCGVTVPLAERRLNGFENVMTMLAKGWRDTCPIRPARELRMFPATRTSYELWVLKGERALGSARARLDANSHVSDRSVPDGWVRLLMM